MIGHAARSPGWFRRGTRLTRYREYLASDVEPGESRLETDRTSEFTLEDLTVGPFAHGFGRTAEGQPFAFRTVRSTLTLEIYRADTTTDVPGPEDVVAVVEAAVTDIDLDDARSVRALVRDLVPTAVPVSAQRGATTTVRALLNRLSAVIEGR